MPSGPDVQHAGLLLRRLLWVEAGWNQQEPRPTPSGLPRARQPRAGSQHWPSLRQCVCRRLLLSDPRGQQCEDQNRSEYSVVLSVCLPQPSSRSRLGTPLLCVCVYAYVYFVKTSFKTLFFQSSFRFTTKPRGKNRPSLIFPRRPPSHRQHHSPEQYLSPRAEPTLTRHSLPRSVFHL